MDAPMDVGDAVNIIAKSYEQDGQQHVYLDHAQGLMVLHPDVLLSGKLIFPLNGLQDGGSCLMQCRVSRPCQHLQHPC